MTVDWLQEFISRTGFPIAVAVYVLWRMNGKFDRLTDAVKGLGQAMHDCQARHDLCDLPPDRRPRRG